MIKGKALKLLSIHLGMKNKQLQRDCCGLPQVIQLAFGGARIQSQKYVTSNVKQRLKHCHVFKPDVNPRRRMLAVIERIWSQHIRYRFARLPYELVQRN